MKGLLGKLFSTKGFLLTAAAATTMTVAPFVKNLSKPEKPEPEKPVPRKISNFTYHAEVTNISAINTQSSPEQGLKHSSESGVTSVGNHSRTNPDEANHSIYIDVSIDNGPEAITVKHSHRPKSKLSENQQVDEHLTEDTTNTHTYFILPTEVETGFFTQTIRRVNVKNPKGFSVATVPTEDSDLNHKIRKYNRLFATNKSDPEISELEQAVRNSAKLIGGKKGKAIEFGIDGFKRVLEKKEINRRDFLKQKYGKGYQVIKAPLQVSNEKESGSNPIGRTTILEIDTSKLEEPKEGYIEIPQITFSRKGKRVGLEKLAYKFEIKKPKETTFRKQLPLDKVLLGSWESVGMSYHGNNVASLTVNKNSKIEIIKPDGLPVVNATPINIKDPDAHKYYNSRRTFVIRSDDIIFTGGQSYKKIGTQTQNISVAKRLLGKWNENNTGSTYEISENRFTYTNKKDVESCAIEKPIRKIGETYIITLRKKDGKKREIIAAQTGKNTMEFISYYHKHPLTRKK
jgi:hypothetical protein